MVPGEIYFADVPFSGHRPVIIVSRGELNRGSQVVAVLITSSRFQTRSRLPNCVAFRAGEFGLTVDCVAQAESVTRLSLDSIDLDAGPIGFLDETALRDIIRAIGYMLDADCEPI